MSHIFSEAARSVALRSSLAPPLVLAVGVLSSLGPCAAPRLLAIVACCGSARNASRITCSFLCGLIAAYASLGFAASLFGQLLEIATWTYAVVAFSLFVGGVSTLIRADERACEHAHGIEKKQPASRTSAFFLGTSFAFTIAPCCTPLVATIVCYTTEIGDPLYGAAMLALFATGHALPLLFLGLASGALAERLRTFSLRQAGATVSGTIMIVLSAFYWCLA